MKIAKIFLVASMFFVFTQCKLESDPQSYEYYNFKTDFNVDYPVDTISLGDTLWVNSEIMGYLMDSASKQNIHFNQALINYNLVLRAWNKEIQQAQNKNASIEFQTYASSISYTNAATLIGFYYYQSGAKFMMKIGLVFHTSGVYSIDADYLKFKNYYNNSEQLFGGGLMDFTNIDGVKKSAYLKGEIIAENNNMHLYNSLSDTDKSSFQSINESNQMKYFFIKVN